MSFAPVTDVIQDSAASLVQWIYGGAASKDGTAKFWNAGAARLGVPVPGSARKHYLGRSGWFSPQVEQMVAVRAGLACTPHPEPDSPPWRMYKTAEPGEGASYERRGRGPEDPAGQIAVKPRAPSRCGKMPWTSRRGGYMRSRARPRPGRKEGGPRQHGPALGFYTALSRQYAWPHPTTQ